MQDWDSAQYLKFQKQRTQPAVDLVKRIPLDNPRDVIDIGCGPGNSTQVLRLQYPQANITGVDSSENMIHTAAALHKDLDFRLCDAQTELTAMEQKFDVVFSNACIQWIPEHCILLQNMMSLLRDDGVMAVQVPMNYDEPIHKIIKKIAKSDKWSYKFTNAREFYTLTPERYFDVLSKISRDFTMWQTTYFHKMKSHADIMEWYRATGLRPYLAVLSAAEKAQFENEVFLEVVKAYPKQENGELIFRFPRLFFTAMK